MSSFCLATKLYYLNKKTICGNAKMILVGREYLFKEVEIVVASDCGGSLGLKPSHRQLLWNC